MNLKIVIHIVILFVIPIKVFGQIVEFSNYYDFGYAEAGYCVQQTPDSGYVVAGRQGIWLSSAKMLILKTDKNGTQEWATLIGDGSNEIYGYYITNCSDGGYAAVGYTTGVGFVSDVFVVRLNALGDTLWTRQYGTNYIEEGTCIQQTNDSGFVISFWDENDSSGLIKIDSIGNIEWTKKYYLAGSPFFENIIKIASGGYLLTGKSEMGPPLWSQGIVMRTDLNGDSLWYRTFGNTNGEQFFEADETFDGNIIIGGISSEASVGGWYGAYILKLDLNGDTIWTKLYPAIDNDEIYSIQTCDDGGYIVGGTSYIVGNGSAYLMRINQFGDTIWTKRYGEIDDDYGYSVRQTLDGGYILAGMTSNWDPQGAGVYLVKVDSLGSTVFVAEIPFDQSVYISAFPNPTNGYSRFQFESISDYDVFVFDMRGSLIFNKKTQPIDGFIEDVIDFSMYENGIYTVKFVSEKNFFSAKIIKTN